MFIYFKIEKCSKWTENTTNCRFLFFFYLRKIKSSVDRLRKRKIYQKETKAPTRNSFLKFRWLKRADERQKKKKKLPSGKTTQNGLFSGASRKEWDIKRKTNNSFLPLSKTTDERGKTNELVIYTNKLYRLREKKISKTKILHWKKGITSKIKEWIIPKEKFGFEIINYFAQQNRNMADIL